MHRVDQMSNTFNVADDEPAILFGPTLEGAPEDIEIPPFYLSLKLHDLILHNSMLDSGASHNLMPKAIMDKMGLSITQFYHSPYSFDSRRVKFLGLIKDLVLSLDQILAKNVLMDVVVADIPPSFGMLLSRSWGEKLKGTLQLDFSYTTIPGFRQLQKLYRENKMKFMISSKDKPVNHSIHAVHTDLDSFIMFSDMDSVDEESQLVEISEVPNLMGNIHETITAESKEIGEESRQPTNPIEEIQRIVQKETFFELAIQYPKNKEIHISEILFLEEENGLWTTDFDGALGRAGAGIGVSILGPLHQPNKIPPNVRMSSYKLAFECSNNEAEYEVLIAGLKILKKLGEKYIYVYGDSKLVIKQVKGEY